MTEPGHSASPGPARAAGAGAAAGRRSRAAPAGAARRPERRHAVLQVRLQPDAVPRGQPQHRRQQQPGVLVEEAAGPRPAGCQPVRAYRSTSSASTVRPVSGERAYSAAAGTATSPGSSRPASPTADDRGEVPVPAAGPAPPPTPAISGSSSTAARGVAGQQVGEQRGEHRAVAGAGHRDGAPGRGDLDVQRQLQVPAAARPRRARAAACAAPPWARPAARRPAAAARRGEQVGVAGRSTCRSCHCVHRRQRVAGRRLGQPRVPGAQRVAQRRRRRAARAGRPTKPTAVRRRLQVVAQHVGACPSRAGYARTGAGCAPRSPAVRSQQRRRYPPGQRGQRGQHVRAPVSRSRAALCARGRSATARLTGRRSARPRAGRTCHGVAGDASSVTSRSGGIHGVQHFDPVERVPPAPGAPRSAPVTIRRDRGHRAPATGPDRAGTGTAEALPDAAPSSRRRTTSVVRQRGGEAGQQLRGQLGEVGGGQGRRGRPVVVIAPARASGGRAGGPGRCGDLMVGCRVSSRRAGWAGCPQVVERIGGQAHRASSP